MSGKRNSSTCSGRVETHAYPVRGLRAVLIAWLFVLLRGTGAQCNDKKTTARAQAWTRAYLISSARPQALVVFLALRRALMRLLRREAWFLWITPFWAVRSMTLMAFLKASVAFSSEPCISCSLKSLKA